MPGWVPRIVLTLLAPLTLLVLVSTYISASSYYNFHVERGSRKELETKTGITFPRYKTVEKRHFTYGPGSNGDFTMEKTVELDASGIQEFYSQIEAKIQEETPGDGTAKSSGWAYTADGNYTYNYNFWGMDDHTLELHVDKESRQVRIVFGQF